MAATTPTPKLVKIAFFGGGAMAMGILYAVAANNLYSYFGRHPDVPRFFSGEQPRLVLDSAAFGVAALYACATYWGSPSNVLKGIALAIFVATASYLIPPYLMGDQTRAAFPATPTSLFNVGDHVAVGEADGRDVGALCKIANDQGKIVDGTAFTKATIDPGVVLTLALAGGVESGGVWIQALFNGRVVKAFCIVSQNDMTPTTRSATPIVRLTPAGG